MTDAIEFLNKRVKELDRQKEYLIDCGYKFDGRQLQEKIEAIQMVMDLIDLEIKKREFEAKGRKNE